MSRRPSSRQWLDRQNRDVYTKQARLSHYRSRAVYKLIEIDEKYRLFKPGMRVIDLGAAPGSWSQYVIEKIGEKGLLLAVDILAMDAIVGADIIKGDFTEQEIFDQCLERLNNQQVDIVISDMAPNMSGIKAADQAKSVYLLELVLDLARNILKPKGQMLVKCFQGAGIDQYKQEVKESFAKSMVIKPKASRESSREFYMLAQGFTL